MIRYLKLLLWILTIVFVGYYFFTVISNNWDQIRNLKLVGEKSDQVLLIISALTVYLVNSLSWHLVTRALGLKLSFLQNLHIWVLSNASRFIPGVIWQYAGRVYLAGEQGVSKTLATVCLQVEALFTLFAGALTIMIVLHYWHLPINLPINLISILTLISVTLFIVIFTNRNILKTLSLYLAKLTKREIFLDQAVLPKIWLPALLASFLLQFVVDGAVLFFLTRNLIEVQYSLYPMFIAVFAISWLTGYVSFFAPSGLGVQEITMTALLSLFIPLPVATIVAILFRLVLLGSEAITILITSALSKAVVARS